MAEEGPEIKAIDKGENSCMAPLLSVIDVFVARLSCTGNERLGCLREML